MTTNESDDSVGAARRAAFVELCQHNWEVSNQLLDVLLESLREDIRARADEADAPYWQTSTLRLMDELTPSSLSKMLGIHLVAMYRLARQGL